MTTNWSEAHDAYEDASPVERAIAAVAKRHDLTDDQLRPTVIRASEDGMIVVVEFGD